jgi:hypothetical protein
VAVLHAAHLIQNLVFLDHDPHHVSRRIRVIHLLLTRLPFRKPRNAASKRALEARAPKEIEDEKTVIFVKGTHVGERVAGAMKDLVSMFPFLLNACT